MQYGFVIDNRKCIGCHACTTACKSEHDVPVGVNRTWVKQVEKGSFPDVKRHFSVLRCNHCTDAPCVTICPTEALFVRNDGIVDFDKDRCIGCKSCMQACPYDALYIDPETNTAAKCNYCAHRIDVGLEPACVNVCPEEAIISGDMDDPASNISKLLKEQSTKMRKPEKLTQPNLFYIAAEEVSIVPEAASRTEGSLWGSQSLGVGHYAKEAEKLAFTNKDVLNEYFKQYGATEEEPEPTKKLKSIELLMDQAKSVYDTPDKGILWGKEVSMYVWTKAIAAGAFLIPFLAWAFNLAPIRSDFLWTGLIVSLIFLAITGVLLVMDLDQPKRFLYVLLRPQWKSWLVKGAYAITGFGGGISLLAAAKFFGWEGIIPIVMYVTAALAVIVAIYTAFLFGQSKARELWQSPLLAVHMLLHCIMAGAAIFVITQLFLGIDESWMLFLRKTLISALVINLAVIAYEVFAKHSSNELQITMDSITKGRYRNNFLFGSIIFGCILPMILLILPISNALVSNLAAIAILIGIYIHEHIWVEAPQRIHLS